MIVPYITGQVVDLTTLPRDEFADAMLMWANDDAVTHHMVTGHRPTTREQLLRQYDGYEAEGAVLFGIRSREQGLVGHVGLFTIDWVARHAALRILIGGEGARGKGWGTEATRLCTAYGFERLNLNKVWLGVNADNLGAVRCYEKAGFVKEGVLRSEIFRNGRYYDAIRYSILRDEWR